MAVNPVLAQDAVTKDMFPLPSAGEVFFLKRDHIDFSVSGPGGTSMKGSGVFFLSSKRVVFLKKGEIKKHVQFSSFELPLHLISDAKFEQPIFGANYMRGKVDPNASAETPVQGTCTWRLTFNAGGCGTFINVFFKLWNAALKRQQPSADLVQQLRLGTAAAFSDPNDPSTIYVTQPVPLGVPPAPAAVAARTGVPPAYQISPFQAVTQLPQGQVYYPPPAQPQPYYPPPGQPAGYSPAVGVPIGGGPPAVAGQPYMQAASQQGYPPYAVPSPPYYNPPAGVTQAAAAPPSPYPPAVAGQSSQQQSAVAGPTPNLDSQSQS